MTMVNAALAAYRGLLKRGKEGSARRIAALSANPFLVEEKTPGPNLFSRPI